MRIVSYGRGNYYFLTDAQFAKAMDFWSKGQPAWIPSIEALLPVSRNPSGVPPEHRGLRICYSWNMPGWVGIQVPVKNNDGKEIKRAAVYARELDRRYEKGERYYWREINVLEPHKFGDLSPDMTSDDVLAYINKIGVTDIDKILGDPNLRNAVPLEQLLPEYLLV